MQVDTLYNRIISNYLHEKFDNIHLVDIKYEYLRSKFNIIVEVEFSVVDVIEIRINSNYYDEEEFNIDYIKLTLFHKIKDEVLKHFIKGDVSRYETESY